MKKVLEGIKSIPGVSGGFFFDPVRGVIENNLPPLFQTERLAQVGQILNKMYTMSNTSLENVSDLSLVYDESVISMRRVGSDGALVILCDPSLNQNLLTMSLNVVSADLERIGSEMDGAGEIPEAEVSELASALEQIAGEDLINDSPLSSQLQGMQSALFHVIGPMAQLIFDDAVEKWIQSGSPSAQGLPALAELVAREIGDAEKEDDYMRRIQSHLS